MPKEIVPNELIQFVGLNDLSDDERDVVHSISSDGFQKVKRILHNVVNLTVHVKSHSKEGSKKKFSIHVHVRAPTHSFDSSHAVDWELPAAMHKAFDEVRHQIEHNFHSNVSRPDR